MTTEARSTKEDAQAQMNKAFTGCLSGNPPTREYLEALREQALNFAEAMDAAIQVYDMHHPKPGHTRSSQATLCDMVDACQDNGGTASMNVRGGRCYIFPTEEQKEAARIACCNILSENDWSESHVQTVWDDGRPGLLLTAP
jgi:hypothetical protein